MKQIWRFPIDMTEAANNEARFTLEVPVGARILHVALLQRAPHEPSLWIKFDPDREPVTHTFEIVGTGNPVPEHSEYVGTWQQDGYVWHLFEVIGS